MDDFTRLKKKISRDIKDVRLRIKERNDLLGKTDNNTVTVKMSAQIRTQIKECMKQIEELSVLQQQDQEKLEKKKLKKKPVSESDEKEMEYRLEIVDLCKKHVDECKSLERSGHKGANSPLFGDDANNDKPLITELPDIDGDEGFQLLRRNDARIDQQLELVSQGVNVLREMAVEMGKEIELQGTMMTELDDKVERAQTHLNALNKRLKDVLTNVRKGDRFIIDFILLVILLALGGYIYNIVK